jgi:tRNA pseudouridine32 synthase / 2,5-diamino-6-(5-phospho-D-ribitylamino)-pyrimidin-4(3H)-one deaminase
MEEVALDESVFERTGEFRIKCRPYATSRVLNCKERWRGRTVSDIFETEFGVSRREVTEKTERLSILINSHACLPDTKVVNGDTIFHEWMASEPELNLSAPIRIIYRSGDIVAVFKPHGLPTGPQGRYFMSNLTSMLRSGPEQYMQPLNRLDRAVAGVVVFSLSPNITADNTIQRKLYIAQVDIRKHVVAGPTVCSAKLRVQKHVRNQVLHTVIDGESGKESITKFRPISASREFILCEPITGRTHQIRAHLAYLGTPIVGDHNYTAEGLPDLKTQPETIRLMAVEYSVRVGDGNSVQIRVPRPDWIPNDVWDAYIDLGTVNG